MSYLYVANLDQFDRREQLEFQRDDGSVAIITIGHYYDLSATELARARRYVSLVSSATPADEAPIGIVRLPIKGNPTNGQIPQWSVAEGAFTPATISGATGGPFAPAADLDAVTSRTTAVEGKVPRDIVNEVNTNGTTSVVASLTAIAAECVADGRSLHLGWKTGVVGYAIDSRWTLPSGLTITRHPNAFLIVRGVDGASGNAMVFATGTESTKVNLTNNIAAVAVSTTLPTGEVAAKGIVRGSLIRFESQRIVYVLDGAADTVGRAMEERKVVAVSGDTVTWTAPLEYDYTTADTAQFSVIDPWEGNVDLGFKADTSVVTPGTSKSYAFRLQFGESNRIRTTLKGPMTGGTLILNCWEPEVNTSFDGLPSYTDSFGYGAAFAGSCVNYRAHVVGRDCRHGHTTLADTRAGNINWGGPQRGTVTGFGENAAGSLAFFDTHPYSDDIVFESCVAFGGREGTTAMGFQNRGRRTIYNDCRALKCWRGFGDTVQAEDMIVNGGEVAYCSANGVSQSSRSGAFKNTEIHHNLIGVVWGSTAIDPHTEGCEIYENGTGIQDQGATRPRASNCFIPHSNYWDITVTGTTTNGSAVVTGISSTADMIANMSVTGAGIGIPAGTKIKSVDSASQITMTALVTTGAGTGSIVTRPWARQAAGDQTIAVLNAGATADIASCSCLGYGSGVNPFFGANAAARIRDTNYDTLPTIVSAATIQLRGSGSYKVSGTTGITAITGVPANETVTLIFTGATTITASSTLKLQGGRNFDSLVDDFLQLTSDGTNLFETGRGGARSGVAKLTADLTAVTSTTLANMTGLSFSVVAGRTYKISACVIFQTAAATTGIAIGATTPAITRYAMTVDTNAGADSTTGDYHGTLNTSGDAVISPGVEVANTDYIANLSGVLIASANGTFQLQQATEVAASAVTVRQGSYVAWDVI